MPSPDPSDLVSVPLFKSLSPGELADVAAWFEVKAVAEGVRLIGEGTTGYSFFVIGEGGVSVTVQAGELALLGPGDFFGEMALLQAARRTATVVTTAPSRLFVLFGDDFARLLASYPSVAAEIEATMQARLQRG